MPEQLCVLISSLSDIDNGLSWDDQEVGRRLRIDVSKGDAVLILIDNVRGDFTRNNLLKEGHAELNKRL